MGRESADRSRSAGVATETADRSRSAGVAAETADRSRSAGDATGSRRSAGAGGPLPWGDLSPGVRGGDGGSADAPRAESRVPDAVEHPGRSSGDGAGGRPSRVLGGLGGGGLRL